MSIKKNSRKGTIGSDAQQKTEPATANSQRIFRQQKTIKLTANRRLQKANAGKEAKRKNEAESPADQKAEHATRGAVHKQQRQERFDRRRQSNTEDQTPLSKTQKKNVTTSAAAAAAAAVAASPTDQSKASSSTPRARHTEENPKPTNQISPPDPDKKRSSLDRLLQTAPEAHKDGYRAMKYSYRLIHLTHTIQSENPGISVFDGLVEHFNTVETELDRIIEHSRRNYDAEVDQDRISPTETDGKRGKRVVSEDRSGAPVNTRARKRVRK